MAPTSQTASDTHRLAQTGLSLVAVRAIDRAFASLDLHRLKATMPDFTANIAAIVRHYAPAASVLAIEHYTEQRLAAGVAGTFRPQASDAVPLGQIASNVRWATRPLWGPSPDVEAAQTNLEGAVGRLVQNAGRDTTVMNVAEDRQARGWARETRGDACYFCALMAARGAVYKDEAAAGGAANDAARTGKQYPEGKFTGSGEFKFHNNCHCVAVPVFGVFEKSAGARRWNRQYNDLKRELGRAPSLLEWRHAFDRAASNASSAS